MDCERFDKNSMELLFGELDELSEAAALRHLHHCTRCRSLWGHLKATKEVAQLPLEEPPEDLFSSIVAAERVAQRELSLRERTSRAISVMAEYAMRPQLAMAALLVLMVGSSMVFIRARPNPENDAMRVFEQGTPRQQADASATQRSAKVFAGDPTVNAKLALDEKTGGGAGENELEADSSSGGPKETYALALMAYQEGRYAEAERLFSEVALSGGSKAGPAALHEGHSARNGSGCQRAAPIYERVTDSFSGTVGDEARWHAATCFRSMGRSESAVVHFRSLLQSAAYALRAREALDELGAVDSALALASPPDTEEAQEESEEDAMGRARPAAPTASSASAKMPEKTHPSGSSKASGGSGTSDGPSQATGTAPGPGVVEDSGDSSANTQGTAKPK